MFLVSGHSILALPKQKEVASSSNVCLSFRRILTRPIFPFSSFPSGFGRKRDSAQTEWTMGTVLLPWAGTVGHIRGRVIMGGREKPNKKRRRRRHKGDGTGYSQKGFFLPFFDAAFAHLRMSSNKSFLWFSGGFQTMNGSFFPFCVCPGGFLFSSSFYAAAYSFFE